MANQELPLIPTNRTCPFHPPSEYKQLRIEQPISKVQTTRGDTAWLVTKYKDIITVLSDHRFSSDPRTLGFPTYITGNVPPPPGFFLQADDPDHKRLRRAVTKEFLSVYVDTLRPKMQQVFDNILDDVLKMTPPVDLVKVLTVPAASQIICELLGVSLEEYPLVREATEIILDVGRSAEETEVAAINLMGYFDQLVIAKKVSPTDDLLSNLIKEAGQNGQPNHEELVGLAALLLLSGYDTVSLVMGLGIVTLLQHPDQLASFLADPSLATALVDELVRYVSINHAGLPRAATADVEVGGQLIRAGEGVVVMVNSGNRDESAFENPDSFDIHRKERNHVGFGHGIHKCLGIHFAYAELEIAFLTLFCRIPDLRLATNIENLSFRHEMVLYGLKTLPVTW